MLLDTNIIIYFAKPGGEKLAPWVNHPDAAVSLISKVEALGYHQIADAERLELSIIFFRLPVLPLDESIATRAISLRQQKKMGLADSIIAATALEYGLPLVTRNVPDFRHILQLDITNPFDNLHNS